MCYTVIMPHDIRDSAFPPTTPINPMKVVKTTRPFDGRVVKVRVDDIDSPHGRITREVVEHAPCVGILVMPTPKTILLVNQYRHPIGRGVWEIPAGKIEPGEDKADAAKRELYEETGYHVCKIQFITSFFTSPGFTDERIYLYEGINLVKDANHRNTEPGEEDIELREWDLTEATVQLGLAIEDVKTQLAIMYATQRLDAEWVYKEYIERTYH